MFADEYKYNLPKELIADAPASPRDAARLFVYKTSSDEIVFDIFANISKYIPAGSILVINDTKVVPARLQLAKKTGGIVNILFLMNEWGGGETIKGLPDRNIPIGETLSLAGKPVAEVLSNEKEDFSFRLILSPEEFKQTVDMHGSTPLPPYIHSSMPEEKIRQEYQTTFASNPASVAAPTASLHFTEAVFKSLEGKGIQKVPITLHVGRGTFSPVTVESEKAGRLHSEPIHIGKKEAQAIRAAKEGKRVVVASGTTVVRAIESAAKNILSGEGFDGGTALFVRPPYDFKVTDALITNFHLPGTSLLALLDAFLKFKGAKKQWKELYDMAAKDRFRFYSFGDAMLIL